MESGPVKAKVIRPLRANADLPANRSFGLVSGAAGPGKPLTEKGKIGTHSNQMLSSPRSCKPSGNLGGPVVFLGERLTHRIA
jgi:hypothetical protein